MTGHMLQEQAVTEQQFRAVCSKFPTGVTVTTTISDAGHPQGVTLNSFTSVSLAPPLVLVCIHRKSVIVPMLTVGRCFAINLLSEFQKDLSHRFSQKSGERFVGVTWYSGPCGVPLLAGATAALECEVARKIAAGDHIVFIGQVKYLHNGVDSPLAYVNSGYRQLANYNGSDGVAETNRFTVPGSSGIRL